MNEERLRILEMVAEGKISAEEAEKLMETMERSDNMFQGKPKKPSTRKSKSLKILVQEGGKEKVNLSIPLSLAQAFSGFIPKDAKSKLEDKNINISELLENLETGSEDGKLIDIDEGNEHVEIRIE
ncbi:MAG: SHOCT-like domain-containing protein [Bacillota bacterium]